MINVNSALSIALLVLALCSCKPKDHDWNVALIAGYSLTYYECVPDDSFFIVNNRDKVIVAPQVTRIAYNDLFIWGEVDPNGDKAFGHISAGLFVINTATGELVAGLEKHKFAVDYPSLLLSNLAPSSSFWKPRHGVYQPHQQR